MDVLNVLQALVDKSGIVAELERDGGAELAACEGYIPNQSNVLKMLGYFSLIGQLRVMGGGGGAGGGLRFVLCAGLVGWTAVENATYGTKQHVGYGCLGLLCVRVFECCVFNLIPPPKHPRNSVFVCGC
jgi:hypothetical protein